MILLDTHVLIWMSIDPDRLSKTALEAIRKARAADGLAVATMTLLELARVAASQRLVVSGGVEEFVREAVSRVAVKPMTPEIVALSIRLPASYPKDPVDRVIAATAIVERIPLVTADHAIQQSGVVETIW